MIKTLDRPEMTLVGMNIHTRPMSPDIPALWPKFVARIGEIENPSEPRVSYGVMRHAASATEGLSYMAAVAAGPVYRLLGARDLGTSDDYNKEKMPAVNVSMLDGQLGWRQHDGGHTDAPSWKYFIPWAERFLGRPPGR